MRARHLFAVLAAALATPAAAVELNVISSVDVADAGSEVVLTVKGTKRPSFTTFSMADEPRFVIDFSESKLQGVPAEMGGAGGIVKQVKSMSYGSDASAIARVIIVFTTEVDPPAIEDSGTGLVVRIAKPGGAAAVAAAPAADAKAQADADAKSKADAKAKADADAKAKADADAKAQADADAKARADADAKARADADAKARADADAKARADADAKARADADAKARADADAKARADADAKAKADKDARAAADADAKAKADKDARAAADAKAKADADATAPAAGGDSEQDALDAEIAAAREDAKGAKAGKPAKAEPSPKAAPPPVVVTPPPGDEDAEQKALDAEIASARDTRKKPARDVESLSPDAAPAKVREVGFKQLPGVSRVFVRTSTTVQFRVSDVDEQTVQIEVENAHATRKNDLRLLDTSFFSSAVQAITPSRQGTSYILTVKLRQRVPYAQKVVGDMVAVDFQRPPTTAAATTAATPASPVEEPGPSDRVE